MNEIWSECPGNLMGGQPVRERMVYWRNKLPQWEPGNQSVESSLPVTEGFEQIISKVPSNPKDCDSKSQALHSVQSAAVGCISDPLSQTRSWEASSMCQCPCLHPQQTAASAGISQCKYCWVDVWSNRSSWKSPSCSSCREWDAQDTCS